MKIFYVSVLFLVSCYAQDNVLSKDDVIGVKKSGQDSVKSGDASHDEAYNSIITNYYTTDPFFGANSAVKKAPKILAPPPPPRRIISDRRMTQPDPLEGSKRKKVKVLLRKMIPAPLLSHISSDEDIEERFSTTPIAVTQENKNIQQSKIPAPLLVGGASNQKNENLGFDEATEASIREAEERNRFKRMHLRNPTQESQDPSPRPERGVFSQLLPQEKKPSQELKKNEEQKLDSPKEKQEEKKEEKEDKKNTKTNGFYEEEMKKEKTKEKESFFGAETKKFNFQEDENDDFFGSIDTENPPPFFENNENFKNIENFKNVGEKRRGYYGQGKKEKESFNFKEDDERDGFFGIVEIPKERPSFFENENPQGRPSFFDRASEKRRGFYDEGKREKESFNFSEDEESENFFGNVQEDDEKPGFFNDKKRPDIFEQSRPNRKQAEGVSKKGPGFLSGEQEKFNFIEDRSKPLFPGDERADIPVLPQIENPGQKEPNTIFQPDRKSQTYFDIMSDFFDEPQINIFPTEKNVATRSANYAPSLPPAVAKQGPGFYGEQKSEKLRDFSRQVIPITPKGHKYSEPLRYHNPLDVDHNDADVGFYQGPKYGGEQPKQRPLTPLPPPPPPPPPFKPPHRPRLLEELAPQNDFLDVPKIGANSEDFFGQALRQNSFDENFSFDETPTPSPRSNPGPGFGGGKVPPNFSRPSIGSQLDRAPEPRTPSFAGFGETDFEEPNFDVRQNFQDLRPEFRDIDDGSFNKIESKPSSPQFDNRQNLRGFRDVNDGSLHQARQLRPTPTAAKSEALRLEEAPMPNLPPPPEMLEMQKNSLFPVDVPKLGANLPYRPPELVFDEFHNQKNPPQYQARENNYNYFNGKSVSKKEAPAEQFFAPIRADLSEFLEENDEPENNEPPFFRSTSSSQTKKGRAVFRSTPSQFEKAPDEFGPTEPGHFERARAEFEGSSSRDEFQPTPSSEFELSQAEFQSTPPFEPVRANVRPFEEDSSTFITPTEPTRFESKQNKFARQVTPESNNDFSPVSRPEGYSKRPARQPEPYTARPPITHSESNKGSLINPPHSFHQLKPFNPQSETGFKQKPEPSYNTRPESRFNPKPEVNYNPESNYNPRPVSNSNKFIGPSPNRDNKIESFSEFSAIPQKTEKVHPSLGDPAIGRPDPFEFHQKIASQFDGSRTDDKENEILFSASRALENDPFQVTDPPIFSDRSHRVSMEAPLKAETYESEPQSRLRGRQVQHSVDEQDSNYAIYDPKYDERSDFNQNPQSHDFTKRTDSFNESPYKEFESGKYMQARSLDIDDNIDNFAERRSFDLGRALQYPTVSEYSPEVGIADDAHQFTQVEDRSKFRAGHSRGNSRHHIHDSQHHDKQKHREEVNFEALLAAATASVRGPLSTFDDWSQKIMSTNSIDTNYRQTKDK